MRRFGIALAGCVIFYMLLANSYWSIAQEAVPTVTPSISAGSIPLPTATLSADNILAEAQRLNDQNDRLLNTINSESGIIADVLGLTGLVGAVIAIAGSIGAFLGYRSNRAVGEELKRQLDEVGKTLADAKSTQIIANNQLSQTEVYQKQVEGTTQGLALTQLAMQQIEIGNLSTARNSLIQSANLDPANRVIHYFLGDTYLRLGDLQSGLEELEKARLNAKVGEFPSADVSYAYALRLRGAKQQEKERRDDDYATAAQIFVKIYGIDRDLLDISGESVFGALAALYRRQGRIKDAIEIYENAHRLTPQNSYPLINLALLYFGQGKSTEAKTYFEQALKAVSQKILVKPTDYWACLDRITAEIALGEKLDVISEHLQTAIGLMPTAITDPLEKFSDGLKALESAPQLQPEIDNLIKEIIRRVETEINKRTKSPAQTNP